MNGGWLGYEQRVGKELSSMPGKEEEGTEQRQRWGIKPASIELIHYVQLVLLGDSGVGKSCIVLRFVCGQFDPTSKVTVGASFLSQTLALEDSTTVKYEIWDTAGQERYIQGDLIKPLF
ncbi:hypothetical protein EJB05_22203, partial [Eragrostis curvula]